MNALPPNESMSTDEQGKRIGRARILLVASLNIQLVAGLVNTDTLNNLLGGLVSNTIESNIVSLLLIASICLLLVGIKLSVGWRKTRND